jgi:hypothetical protein
MGNNGSKNEIEQWETIDQKSEIEQWETMDQRTKLNNGKQ